ncbi:MAG: class I SAM-dependent methyltransferase [Pseudomonadota bacterium]
MSDGETLKFYSDGAADYAAFVGDGTTDPRLTAFIKRLSPGAAVLDFGCGHGWAAAVLTGLGYEVTATDGSAGFAAEAARRYGLTVRVETFDELSAEDAFDGLWVSFSLLHDSREALPDHLSRLRRAARPGATLYLGLKEGEGRHRDHLGRLYTYFSEDELRARLAEAGWADITCERTSEPGMAGKNETALHLFATAG